MAVFWVNMYYFVVTKDKALTQYIRYSNCHTVKHRTIIFIGTVLNWIYAWKQHKSAFFKIK